MSRPARGDSIHVRHGGQCWAGVLTDPATADPVETHRDDTIYGVHVYRHMTPGQPPDGWYHFIGHLAPRTDGRIVLRIDNVFHLASECDD
jgi:hypothetical protein